MKKLNLKQLQVKSFVTDLSNNNCKQVKGGRTSPRMCVPLTDANTLKVGC